MPQAPLPIDEVMPAILLRASDGTSLGRFAIGFAPIPIAFDGSSIWVASSGGHTVSKR